MTSNKLKNVSNTKINLRSFRYKKLFSTNYSDEVVNEDELLHNWSNFNQGRPPLDQDTKINNKSEINKNDTSLNKYNLKEMKANLRRKTTNFKTAPGKKQQKNDSSEVIKQQPEKGLDDVNGDKSEKTEVNLTMVIEDPELDVDNDEMDNEEIEEKTSENGKNQYSHCQRKRSSVKKKSNDDIFYDFVRNVQKPKKKKGDHNKNYFKTAVNTPLNTPSKHMINQLGKDHDISNHINSIHFFNKRNIKTNCMDIQAPNYKVKVDDSLVQNIFERFMRNEKIQYTDSQFNKNTGPNSKDGTYIEPTKEIYNTFYKVYEVFKESQKTIKETNKDIETYNQKMVKPFYETDEFKKALKDEQKNPTQNKELFKAKNNVVTVDDNLKTVSDFCTNLVDVEENNGTKKQQEGTYENAMWVEGKVPNSKIAKTEKDKENSEYELEQVENVMDLDESVKTDKKMDLVVKSTKDNLSLNQIQENMHDINGNCKEKETYINCDQIYFNFDFLTEKLGNFDVLLVDPPWRIRGGQKNDSQFMFSNSKFCLEYNTMSNQEIKNLQLEKLSKKGFIFLWILANQINVASEILNKWGYELIDMIVWVKLRDGKVYLSHGYYFMHSYEICLIGYKCPMGETVEYISKVSNNLLFANIRKKSQKPDELYDVIDMIMPGSKKCEVFARNNNLRPGWFSLGNQLGPQFDKWKNNISCDICEQVITIGTKRYKSKSTANTDICDNCWINKNDGKFDEADYFVLNNDIDEDVLHQYHRCNLCFIEPIWGTRFTCKTCEDFDLCETCFDKNLEMRMETTLPKQGSDNKIQEENTDKKPSQKGELEKLHPSSHEWEAIEIAKLAGGLPAHLDSKCNGCFQKPIIGVVFKCSECNNFCLCQNCYFIKGSRAFKESRGHKADHNYEIFIEAHSQKTSYTCFSCDLIFCNNVYKCENCFNFHFCEKCYINRENFKTNMATTHKQYHKFLKVAN